MGSFLTLGVGRLEVDWGKNSNIRNHSKLFFREDIKDEVYYYAEDHEELKPAFSRSLRKVLPRLELLGYTMEGCRNLYEDLAKAFPKDSEDPDISFDMLQRALARVDLGLMGMGEGESDDYDLGEYAAKVILCDPEFTKTVLRARMIRQ